MCTHTLMHAHTLTYTCMRIHTHTCTHSHTCAQTLIYTCMCTNISVHIQIHSTPSGLTASKLFNTTFHSDKKIKYRRYSPIPHRSQKDPLLTGSDHKSQDGVWGVWCLWKIMHMQLAQALQVSVNTLQVTSYVLMGFQLLC